jgi:two-component system, OmpR family, response regulator VanR
MDTGEEVYWGRMGLWANTGNGFPDRCILSWYGSGCRGCNRGCPFWAAFGFLEYSICFAAFSKLKEKGGWENTMRKDQPVILLVDDDQEIRRFMQLYLHNEGYRILQATNGKEALQLAGSHSIDLMVLDLMMPEMDGLEACIRIREKYWMPIIILTAKTNDLDKIQGLSIGADDYMTKPFNPLELVARIKAHLRRYLYFAAKSSGLKNVITVQHLIIHLLSRQVFANGKEVRLTPREFDILVLLARHPGVVFTAEQIYERVWNEPMLTSNNTIMVHIRKIREKVELDPKRPMVIQTVWGVGYKVQSSPARDSRG